MKDQRRVRRRIVGYLYLMAWVFLALTQLHSDLHAQETVDPHSGRLFVTTTDLVLPAGAVNLEVTRSLQQNAETKGLLGRRWRLNWEAELMRIDPLVLIEEMTGIVSFAQEGNKTEYRGVSGERVVFDQQGRAIRTKMDGTQDIFNEQGRLIERDLRSGNKVTLHYDAGGRLSAMDGPRGNSLRFAYDETGKLTGVEASNGARVRYGYLEENLSEVQVNGGPILRYVYDESRTLLRIDYPQLGAVQFMYDTKGRVLNRTWADGRQERYEYDDEKRIRRHIDAGGGITTSRWSENYRRQTITDPLRNKTTIEYNDAGQPLKVIGPTGAITEIAYDTLGRMVSAKDPLGRTSRFEYLGHTSLPSAMVRKDGTRLVYDYDENNNLKSVKAGDKLILAYTYTRDGLVESTQGIGLPEIRFTYYPNGMRKSEANALNETTLFEYDSRGNLIRETNPLGGVTVRSYDAQNRLVSETDPAGAITLYSYDDKGRLTRIAYPDRRESRFEYDALGRLTAETSPEKRTTCYQYDNSGRLDALIHPNGQIEKYSYDAAGNLTEVTNGKGLTNRYAYNSLGLIAHKINPFGLQTNYRYDSAGRLLSMEDSLGARTDYRYDALGQMTGVIDSNGAETGYQYDVLGTLAQLVSPLGNTKSFTYSPLGQITGVREPNGDQALYESDPAGRLVAVQRPSGGKEEWTYDGMGNLLSVTDPLGNKWRYSYDTAGRLTTMNDSAERETHFIYDVAGRILRTELPDRSKVKYRYDRSGNLQSIDDGTFPVDYLYDQANRITRVDYPSIRKVVGSEYNAQGLKSKLILPDGQNINYEYNDYNQLSALVLPDGKKMLFTYDAKGRQKTISYPNGVTGKWEYEPGGQTARISYEDGQGNVLFDDSYQYDRDGNLIERREVHGRVVRFDYDGVGQLIEESDTGLSVNYRYSAGGNRLEMEKDGKVTSYDYDQNDRMIKAGKDALLWDTDGKLIERRGAGKTIYEYDAMKKLAKVTGEDGRAVSIGYAANGDRVMKRNGKSTSYYLYDGFNLVQEIDTDLRVRATYAYGPGIDRPLSMMYQVKYYFYHCDKLGSIRMITDEEGQIAAEYDYDAFGNITRRKGSLPNPFLFTAREFDEETGLYYNRARYYHPELGRFIAEDPAPAKMDQPIDQNPYVYVKNTPTGFTDPLGLMFAEALGDPWVYPEVMPHPDSPLVEWLKWDLASLRSHMQYLRENGWGSDPEAVRTQAMIDEVKTEINQARGGRSTASTTQPVQRPQSSSGGARSSTMNTIDLEAQRSGGTQANRPGGRSSGTRPINVGESRSATGGGGSTAYGRAVQGAKTGAKGGAAVGGILAIANYHACIEEGRDPWECKKEAAWSLFTGVAIGGAAGAVIAATGGTAAPVVIGVLGTGAAIHSGHKAGERIREAELTKTERERIALQQSQAAERLKNVLANLDPKITELETLGKRVSDTLKEALDAAEKAAGPKGPAKKAEDLKKEFETIKKKVTGDLNKECMEIGTRTLAVVDKAQKAEKWAKKAKKGFKDSISILETCVPPADAIQQAEEWVEAATALTLSSDKKYKSAETEFEQLQKDVKNIKTKIKNIRTRIGSIENRYAAQLTSLKADVSNTKKSVKLTETLFKQLTKDKNSLYQTIKNLKSVWPSDELHLLSSREIRIDRVQPKSIKSLDRAKKLAAESEKKGKAGIKEGADYALIEATLSGCAKTNLTKLGQEVGKAGTAVFKLHKFDAWLVRISQEREICLAKTKKQPAPKTPSTQQAAQPTLTALKISPSRVECETGETINPAFQVTGVYSDGSTGAPPGPVTWSRKGPIKCATPKVMTITASFRGAKPASALVVIKPKQKPSGGLTMTGWGVSPKRTSIPMTEGGKKPSCNFVFAFSYIDYGKPDQPVSYAEVPAQCPIPDSIGTHTIICEAKDPELGRECKDEVVVVVYDPGITERVGQGYGQRPPKPIGGNGDDDDDNGHKPGGRRPGYGEIRKGVDELLQETEKNIPPQGSGGGKKHPSKPQGWVH